MDASFVKAEARKCGADLVGVAPIERFADLPLQLNPRSIHPGARSVVVLGNQVGRGLLRGVKDGTHYGAYATMGSTGLREVLQPVMLWRFVRVLEDRGWEAVPVANNFKWSNIDGIDPDEMGQDFIGVNPAAYGKTDGNWSRPVAPGRAAPDVLLPMRLLGYLAGLGEIGYSGMLLTPEFGPRQMLCAVVTDLDLEPDPLFDGTICDRCMECVRHCPAKALSAERTRRCRVGGRDLEWAEFDFARCSVSFYGGGENAVNPYAFTAEAKARANSQPYTTHMGLPVGGHRGCMIACTAHLAETGRLTRKYHGGFGMPETGGADHV